MGNPQERLHFKIGYILGIVDGEGCYQLESDGKGHFYPSLTISNTDDKIIQQTISYLKDLGIECWSWSPKNYGRETRSYQRIYVKGLRRLKKYLDIFTNYPHAKLERALLLKEFCELRLKIPNKQLYLNGVHNYSKENELRSKLSQLNSRFKGAKSSETIRFGA